MTTIDDLKSEIEDKDFILSIDKILIDNYEFTNKSQSEEIAKLRTQLAETNKSHSEEINMLKTQLAEANLQNLDLDTQIGKLFLHIDDLRKEKMNKEANALQLFTLAQAEMDKFVRFKTGMAEINKQNRTRLAEIIQKHDTYKASNQLGGMSS